MPDFLQQLMRLPAVRSAHLSPDRRWVAFAWYRVREQQDVYVVPCDGSAPPQALTRSDQDSWFVSWTKDSRAVLVRQDHDGDERARLLHIDLDRPGEPTPLTPDRPDYFLRGGDLTPDGKTLVYAINYDVAAGREIEPYWVYRHDLASGVRVPIARPLKPAFSTPSLNDQGTYVLYTRMERGPGGMQAWLVDIDGRDDSEIINLGDKVKVVARWFPDGERILVLADGTGQGDPQPYNSLGIYNRLTGKLDWLIDDPARNIERAWVAPDGAVLVDELILGGHAPSVIGADGVERPFARISGNLRPLGQAANGDWVGLYYSATQPMDLARFDLDVRSAADLRSLTGMWTRTDLTPADLTPAKPVEWQSVDGTSIHGWLYRTKTNLHKAVINIHGGPTFHAEDWLDEELQYYVWRGFNVLDVNYRGSTGYGLAFREAIKIDGWGGREQADIAAGAQWLIDNGLAQPGSVGVFGTSYGGYSTWYLITHYPRERIAAGVPVCGMTDLVIDYHTTRPDLRPYSEEMMGGTPESAPERYHERSPINFVENIRASLMIVQGALDPNVTPENVRQVVARLKANDIPYELVEFADEGHGIYKPANQQALFARIADFFERTLG